MFKGWSAVGHIAAPGAAQVRISQETNGSLLPSPRYQERGVYGVGFDGYGSDPIFSGLTTPMYVDEEHFDEVIDGAYDTSSFTRIVTSSNALTNVPTSPDYQTRSAVQMLKYTGPANRILYSTQFHPEAETTSSAANENGVRLIQNFLSLAHGFWFN